MANNYDGDINAAPLLESSGWLHGMARGLVGDSHRADDLVQGTFLAAFERTQSGRGAPRAWLATVLRNLAYSSARAERHRSARERAVAPSESLPSVDEAIGRAELRQHITDAVLALDSPYREVVILRHLEGLTTREAAQRVGASESAIRTRLSRGLDRLRARLDEDYGGSRQSWMVIALPLARRAEPLAAGAAAAWGGAVAAQGHLLGGRRNLTFDARLDGPRSR